MTQEQLKQGNEITAEIQKLQSSLGAILECNAEDLSLSVPGQWLNIPNGFQKELRTFLIESHENKIHDLQTKLENL